MRHKWVRLREHIYICRTCGAGKAHAQVNGQWETTFHTPDGWSSPRRYTPACEVGEHTPAYLAKYAADIAAGGVPK